MWYGASAPAPACWIHQLHNEGSRPSSQMSRPSTSASRQLSQLSPSSQLSSTMRQPSRKKLQPWDLPCPSWAPLRELRLKREESKRRMALTKSGSFIFSGQCTPQESPSGGTTRPNTGDTPSRGSSPAFARRPPGTEPGNMLAQVASAPSLRNGQAPEGFSRRRNGSVSSERSMSNTAGGRSAVRRQATGSSPSNRVRQAQSRSLSNASSTAGDEKQPKRKANTPAATVKGDITTVSMMSRRRNSFADRLLEAKLGKMDVDARRTILLEGGRRGSFLGPAGQAVKGLKEIRNLYSGDSRLIPHWDPDRMGTCFRRVAKGHTVTVGAQLAEALYMLGHPFPQYDVVDRILTDDLAKRESLDQEDFFTLISKYEFAVEDLLEEAFNNAADHKDNIRLSQLPDVLDEVGLPVMTGLLEELETMNAEEGIDFEMFETLYQEVLQRAGLTHDEHKRLRILFEEIEGVDGTISPQELLSTLNWHESLTNVAGGPAVIHALVQDTVDLMKTGRVCLEASRWKKVAAAAKTAPFGQTIDMDTAFAKNSTKISGTAFMAASSMLHRRIVDGLRTALWNIGEKEEQVRVSSLLGIFEELGFIGAVESTVDAFLLACNLNSKTELSFFEFFTIVFRYGQADGVTEAESKDINAVFQQFDVDGNGTLEADEIGSVIRWLGYQPTQYRVWDFVEEFGIDWHSHIDALEFRRLAAKYKSMRLKEVRKVFQHKDRAADGHTIHIRELERLLLLVGYEPTREDLSRLTEEAGGKDVFIDFHLFKHLELLMRRWVQQTMARNGGFTDGELAKFQRYFEKGDRHHNGFISGRVMRELFFALFPDKSKDLAVHSFIVMTMLEAKVDPGARVDFDTFMSLVEKIQSEMDRQMLLESLRLKQQLGFTNTEIKQFRDLFVCADEDDSGDLEFEEIVNFFTNLNALTMLTKREIMALVLELGNEHRRLDFWAFLQLMHRVSHRKLRLR